MPLFVFFVRDNGHNFDSDIGFGEKWLIKNMSFLEKKTYIIYGLYLAK